MNTAQMLVTGVLGGGLSLQGYLAALAAPLWLRFTETSGNPVNSGTAALTITQTTCTQGQTGKLGVNEAYDMDGANSLVTVTNNAVINISAFTNFALVKLDTFGEGSLGRFLDYNGQENWLTQFDGTLNSAVITATTNATSVSTTTLSTGVYYTLFNTYDDAGDRKIHMYIGVNGAVNEVTYASQVAAVGTLTSKSGALTIGNNAAASRSMDGLYDEFMRYNGIMTTAQMLVVTKLAGV